MKKTALLISMLTTTLALAGLLGLTACGGTEETAAPATEPAAAPAAEPAAAPAAAPAAEPAAAAPAAGGAGVCARAQDCCTAYVAAMGPAGAAAQAGCDALRQTATAGAAAEPGCQASIDGWRAGLQAMGTAVPAACQ